VTDQRVRLSVRLSVRISHERAHGPNFIRNFLCLLLVAVARCLAEIPWDPFSS